MRALFAIALLCSVITGAAQAPGILRGAVRDEAGATLPQANVLLVETKAGVVCDEQGRYRIEVPSRRALTVRWSYSGMTAYEEEVILEPGQERVIDVRLKVHTLGTVNVEGTRRDQRETGVERIDPKLARFNPSPQGGIESLLGGQMGVVMRNELSSGYSVRGGNFDENLVYVNDIEVYRPFLVRAGQQEGLSFPNPDMIERIQFSAGGFEARYGDKMSSVLDIHYKRPRAFAGTAMASLLGGAVSLESAMMKLRLRQVTGIRYRTNQWLFGGSDTQGEYRPVYTDMQTYWTYDLKDNIELGVLGLYSQNKYNVVPETRETEFGPFNQALQFTVYFDGQERTSFETYFGALNLNVRSGKDLLLKFQSSAYRTYEAEHFTIQGQYRLGELERDLGSEQFGEVVRDLGIGTYIEHARNDLEATVFTVAHKGYLQLPNDRYLQWGVDARQETIHDKLSEWDMVDSADFSVPLNTGEALELKYSLKSRLEMESVRANAYVQNTWRWDKGNDRWWTLIAGARGQHWTYNGQTIFSPRARITYHPGWKKVVAPGDTLDRDYSFWLATGVYYQPPFYREVRKPDGTLNPDIRAQRSIHFLLGMDRWFEIWERPFRFSSEAYYKYMDDLIPYEVDNIRIRYYGTNNAKGYAMGVDAKLTGQFIEGIDSWMSVGILSTREDLTDDYYYWYFNANGDTIYPGNTRDQAVDSSRVEPGYIPRPTDQRVNVAMFFQDEMPRWPTFKVHVNLAFGTGLPFGPPNYTRYPDTLRTQIYRRVDIGFSKQFLGADGQSKRGWRKHIDNLWLTAEVFNLLNINNVANHTWITDVTGRQYSIPDYLTPRRFNLKLIAWF